MSKFELVVIRPRKDKAPELVCTYTKAADTVSDAVKQVRYEFAGSGCVVLQASQFGKHAIVEPTDVVEQPNA